MMALIPILPVPVATYRLIHLVPQAPPKAYLCPHCGHLLYWLPSNQWYCPYHGIISKWKYRFV
ncbi:MAG: hypothetical protein QW569_06725 [Candidatus Bathyarchaeia archaeon]|nr:hypothetical protein [Candidatus Bathyarchaeota archaeon]